MHSIVSKRTPYFLLRLSRLQNAPSNRTYLVLRRANNHVLAPLPLSETSLVSLGGYGMASAATQMTGLAEKGPDPHNYTSGRWLRDDTLEREARFIQFDFDALGRRVVSLCPGARSITSYDKKEGGFNRVFIFHTDNGKRMVARLPFKIAGPPRFTTNSEVATIKFLQSKTSTPIPRILDWSDDASNPIGCEYIIMEHASGVPLSERWPMMSSDEQLDCVKAICDKLKEIAKLDFTAYGCLYTVDTPYLNTPTLPLDQDFCIGPHCGTIYWDCNIRYSRYYHKADPDRGPWPDLTAYSEALIAAGISKIPPAEPDVLPKRRYQGSIQAHHQVLEQGRKLINMMSTDPRILKAAVPVLFHPDLHKRNIFVSEEDPTVITAIIDWQSCSIKPSFSYAGDVPDFAQLVPHPSKEGEFEPMSEICAKVHHACLHLLMPKLAVAENLDENLYRPFKYCHRTWDDGVVALRDELIETALHWDRLGFGGSCPFPSPSADELAIHRKNFAEFEAALDMRHSTSQMLNTATDGWVPADAFEATKLLQSELFLEFCRFILEGEKPDPDDPIQTEDDIRRLWPWDLDV